MIKKKNLRKLSKLNWTAAFALILLSVFMLNYFGIVRFQDWIQFGNIVFGQITPILGYIPVSGGMTITSVSHDFGIISPDDDISKFNWMIEAKITGAGQKIVGTLTPEQTKRLGGAPYSSKYPLSIEIKKYNETLFISKTGQTFPIYNYYVVKRVGGIEDSWDSPKMSCPRKYIYKVYEESGPLFGLFRKVRYCVVREQIGEMVYLKGEPDLKFNAEITLRARGKEITKEISSDNSSVEFRDKRTGKLYATASWTGNLVTGEGKPDFSNVIAIHRKGSKKWVVQHIEKWRRYTEKETALLVDLDKIPTNLSRWDPVRTLVSPLLSYANYCSEHWDSCDSFFAKLMEIPENERVALFERGLEYIEDEDKTSGKRYKFVDAGHTTYAPKFKLTIPTRFNRPEILFLVKADWIGIKIPDADGYIASVECPNISSEQDYARIYTNVVLTRPGGVYTVATCDGHEQVNNNQTTAENRVELVSKVFLDGVVEDRLKCKIELKNSNGKLLDTKTTFCKVSKPAECTEGDYDVGDLTVRVCNKNGQWDTILTCKIGYRVKFDEKLKKYVCKEAGSGSIEECGDGIDNDGDGEIDEGCTECGLKDIGANCPITEDCKYKPKPGWTVVYKEQPYWFFWKATEVKCVRTFPWELALTILAGIVIIVIILYVAHKKRWI
ncbi:MAG: hypothetical protein ACTSYD_02080 [Candidatus Heimdallarchaeaceae archaeon]